MSEKPTPPPSGSIPGPRTETVGGARYARHPGPPPLRQGASVGRFVVIERIGSGGMGVVYAAYDPELDRKVALKLLHPRAETPGSSGGFRGRLLREAQALARLAHPNVVTVFDVGSFRDRIFLATELVAGPTLKDWLETENRSRKEILSTFADAGKGLAAAHAASLVHRDFKPGNVIVGDDGRVRVLDFGLARSRGEEASEEAEEEAVITVLELESGFEGLEATAERPGSKAEQKSPLETPITLTGSVLGTPAYMAPEQHAGRPAGAEADQFAFCVALYQALYGAHPFDHMGRPKVSGGEIDWTIAAPPARDRSRMPAYLRRALARGLRREPADRFGSMEELLRELTRDPWAVRRRWLAATGLLVLIAASLFAYRRAVDRKMAVCRGGEERFAAVWSKLVRDASRQAFETTARPYAGDAWAGADAALTDYGRDWAAMHTEACQAGRLRGEQSPELLDLRMDCLGRRLQEVEALAGAFRTADAAIVEKAVEMTAGLTPLSWCADIAALSAPIRPPRDEVTRSRVDEIQGRLAEAKVLQDAGRFDPGLEVAETAAREAEELGYWPLTAEARLRLGVLQEHKGDTEAAVENLDQALLAAQAGGHDRVAVEALTRLVRVVGFLRGDLEGGYEYAAYAAGLLEHLSETGDLEAQLADQLGTLLVRSGDYDKAFTEHRKALAIREDTLGDDHPAIGATLTSLAIVLGERGELEDARDHARRAVEVYERAFGPSHPILVASLNTLGTYTFRLSDYVGAQYHYERAYEIAVESLGRSHPRVGTCLNNLGNVQSELGEYPRALESYRRALEVYRASLGEEHTDVALTLTNVANVFVQQGQHDKARKQYREVLELQESVFGADHPWVASTVFNLGLASSKLGEHRVALDLYRRALGVWESKFGRDHFLLAYGLTGIGEELIELESSSAAVAYLERALYIRQGGPQDPVLLADTQFALARALTALGRQQDRALDLAEQAREGFSAGGDKGSEELAAVDEWIKAQRVASP